MWFRHPYSVLKLACGAMQNTPSTPVTEPLQLRACSPLSGLHAFTQAALTPRMLFPALLFTDYLQVVWETEVKQNQNLLRPAYFWNKENLRQHQWGVTRKLTFLYLENLGIFICLPAPYPEVSVFPRFLYVLKWVIPIQRKQISPIAEEVHPYYKNYSLKGHKYTGPS